MASAMMQHMNQQLAANGAEAMAPQMEATKTHQDLLAGSLRPNQTEGPTTNDYWPTHYNGAANNGQQQQFATQMSSSQQQASNQQHYGQQLQQQPGTAMLYYDNQSDRHYRAAQTATAPTTPATTEGYYAQHHYPAIAASNHQSALDQHQHHHPHHHQPQQYASHHQHHYPGNSLLQVSPSSHQQLAFNGLHTQGHPQQQQHQSASYTSLAAAAVAAAAAAAAAATAGPASANQTTFGQHHQQGHNDPMSQCNLRQTYDSTTTSSSADISEQKSATDRLQEKLAAANQDQGYAHDEGSRHRLLTELNGRLTQSEKECHYQQHQDYHEPSSIKKLSIEQHRTEVTSSLKKKSAHKRLADPSNDIEQQHHNHNNHNQQQQLSAGSENNSELLLLNNSCNNTNQSYQSSSSSSASSSSSTIETSSNYQASPAEAQHQHQQANQSQPISLEYPQAQDQSQHQWAALKTEPGKLEATGAGPAPAPDQYRILATNLGSVAQPTSLAYTGDHESSTAAERQLQRQQQQPAAGCSADSVVVYHHHQLQQQQLNPDARHTATPLVYGGSSRFSVGTAYQDEQQPQLHHRQGFEETTAQDFNGTLLDGDISSIVATSTSSVRRRKVSSDSRDIDEQPESSGLSNANTVAGEYNQSRILEMRKEKSRDAARSRRSKENHEFYELAKLLPLPAAITSQLVNGHPPWAPDFTTLASVNPYNSRQQQPTDYVMNNNNLEEQLLLSSRPTSPPGDNNKSTIPSTVTSSSSSYNNDSTINQSTSAPNTSDLSRHFSAPLLATNSSLEPSTNSIAFNTSATIPYIHGMAPVCHPSEGNPSIIEKSAQKNAGSLFDIHQGTHILQSLDGFAFAIGRDGRFLYISETVSMYLGLSQVEMTGSSVFDYTHQQDHEELARQLGISSTKATLTSNSSSGMSIDSPAAPASVQSQYSAASSETMIEDYMNTSSCSSARKRLKGATTKGGSARKLATNIKSSTTTSKNVINIRQQEHKIVDGDNEDDHSLSTLGKFHPDKMLNDSGTHDDPLVRQFCIRMKSTLTKRGCQHFKSSGYRVVHVVAHLRSYQSNDNGHLMDPLDDASGGDTSVGGGSSSSSNESGKQNQQTKRRGNKGLQANKIPTDRTAKHESDVIKSDYLELNVASNNTVSQMNEPIKQEEQVDKKFKKKQKIIGMVAVAIALPPPSINELRLESDTFVLRLGLDLRVTHIEPKITELLHYPIEMIAGQSFYSMVHPADLHQVEKCHRDLLRKGQMMSGYYRLLSRTGGYIWIQTCATLICNNTILANQIGGPITNSPMPPPTPSISGYSAVNNNNSMIGGHNHHHNHQLQASSDQLNGQTLALANAFELSQINNGKLLSPTSQVGASIEASTQDQDQCLIFVNYMITNVVDKDRVLDVCQSDQLEAPFGQSTSASSAAYLTTTTSSNNNNFNSPASSCSSPCLTSLKGLSNTTNNVASINNSNHIESPATPISGRGSRNLASPLTVRHHRTHNQNTTADHQLSSKPAKLTASKRLLTKSMRQQQLNQASTYSTGGSENVNLTTAENSSIHEFTSSIQQQQAKQILDDGGVYTSNGHYSAMAHSGSLALANKLNQHHNTDSTSWHHQQHNHGTQQTTNHHHQAGAGLGEAAAAVAYGAAAVADYSATVSRYKAAFASAGLGDPTAAAAAAAVSYNQGAAVYPSSYNHHAQQHQVQAHHHHNHHQEQQHAMQHHHQHQQHQHHLHHQQQHLHHHNNNNQMQQEQQVASHQQQASGWDTATAAVAAVAAAATTNLTGALSHHHHTIVGPTPYAHHHHQQHPAQQQQQLPHGHTHQIESSDHQHNNHHPQVAAAAAAAAVAASHATSAATTPYYNYYGYYGNKFI